MAAGGSKPKNRNRHSAGRYGATTSGEGKVVGQVMACVAGSGAAQTRIRIQQANEGKARTVGSTGGNKPMPGAAENNANNARTGRTQAQTRTRTEVYYDGIEASVRRL